MRAAPALVLSYHRIATGPDPLLQAVAPGRFEQQVAALRDVADIVPLPDLDAPSETRRIAITFDDGYADNATVAAPILRSMDVPATFFVASRVLDDPAEFWWDRLEHHHDSGGTSGDGREAEVVDVAPAGRRVRIDVRTGAGRARSLKALNRRLRVLASPDIEPVLAEVARQLGSQPVEEPCARHAVLDRWQVAELARQPGFEIGSHGATHTMLSALDEVELQAEISGSRHALESATGTVVTSFAYPYGTPESFSPDTVSLLRRAGFQRACLNVGGLVHPRHDRYRLPRHMVYDWPGEELAGRVRAWFDD